MIINSRSMCLLFIASSSLYIFSGRATAQLNHAVDSIRHVTVVANEKYNKAGNLKRIFLGDHYRKEWATPVEVPVLNMEIFAGGLTPLKVGGGMQTKSLRMQGNDGRQYVLRMMNKDVSKAIVAELRETFAHDIVQDQVSSANPYAPMVVASLAKAAGVIHSTPQVVYVPRTERLGEFNELFAGSVCLIEERPNGEMVNIEGYGSSKKIVNTEKLLSKVFQNSEHMVEERAFVRARLLDILVGDWDRHDDQWQWAAFDVGKKTVYHPIPRDRDQAFPIMDGFIPKVATRKWGLRKIQDFDYTIRDVHGLNMSGGPLDRNFTTRLSLNEWVSIAREIQASLTDSVIAEAFRLMPGEIYNISGIQITAKLKRRRNDLAKYAESYYRFLSRQVNVTGTMKNEVFNVKRIDNDSTLVVVHSRDEKSGKTEEIYRRTFLRSETREIRMYGLGGHDIFMLSGNVEKGILVRVVGGEGNDDVVDESYVKQRGHQTKIYDNEYGNLAFRGESRYYISNDTLKNNYDRKGFVFDWLAPIVLPSYNVDDGLLINGGFVYKKQQFGKAGYGQMHMLTGGYAFGTRAWSMNYKSVYRELIGKADIQVDIGYHSPSYTRNYYGLGNETIKNADAHKDYYRLRMSQFLFAVTANKPIGKFHTISAGTEWQTVNIEDTDGRFVTSAGSKLDSSQFDRKKFANVRITYQFSTLDHPLFPRKGIRFSAGATYTNNLGADKQFVKLYSEGSAYFTARRLTVGIRSGVATNSNNDYEFFQAQSIGGLDYLRGFRRDRFAGRTSVYQNSELRFRVSNANIYITKGVWGLMAFSDHGRVWIPNENSNTWHHGYGGGIWLLPFNRMTLTASYAVSKEDKLINIKAGVPL